MAPARGRALAIVGALLLVAAGVSAGLRWARSRGWLPEDLALQPRATTVVLLVGAAAAFLLLALFRAGALWLARRQGAHAASSLRPLETLAAIVVALVVALVAAGGLRNALLSAGLIGFGLTLALQRPILALAGWGVVRFGRLFQEGDRIEVQGIVGDVVEISLFNTRLWEVGSEASPLPWGGRVSPLRPTGRIVVVSNATFVEHPLANATRYLPLVFDELVVRVPYEGDWRLAHDLLHGVARDVLDLEAHAAAADRYQRLVAHLPVYDEFPAKPLVVTSLEESWIELRLRYLVDVRDRSHVRTQVAERWEEVRRAHQDRVPYVYDRKQSMQIGADGRPRA